jgi:hypothetical protein
METDEPAFSLSTDTKESKNGGTYLLEIFNAN